MEARDFWTKLLKHPSGEGTTGIIVGLVATSRGSIYWEKAFSNITIFRFKKRRKEQQQQSIDDVEKMANP